METRSDSRTDLNSCLGVRVAVSAWSAGVGQQRKGLQMEKTPRRQKAYSVKRMKLARGTRLYITSLFSRRRSSSVIAMSGSRCDTQHGNFPPTSPYSSKNSGKCNNIFKNIFYFLNIFCWSPEHCNCGGYPQPRTLGYSFAACEVAGAGAWLGAGRGMARAVREPQGGGMGWDAATRLKLTSTWQQQ